jgi:hypothetical protein
MRTQFIRAIPFLTLSLATLIAAEPIATQWSEVCRVSVKHEIRITTIDGENVSGYCLSVKVDEIAVRTQDGKVVRLARTTLSRIQMLPLKSSQVRALGEFMHGGLREGVHALFSPWAPVGMVMIPGTIAIGAVSAPFCAIADLDKKLRGKREVEREIKLI